MVYLTEYRKLNDIVVEEGRKLGVSFEIIMSRRRTPVIVFARTNAIKRIRKETCLSLCEIGYYFRRDYTTVIHALKKEL